MCVLKFVLSAYNVQLLIGLIEGGLQAEGLGAEVAALGVAGVQLGVQIVLLRFPFAHNLVKVLGLLLSYDRCSMRPLVLHGHVFQLINAAKSFSLLFRLPQLDLSLSFGQGVQHIVLLLSLLVNLHTHVLSLS